MGVAINCILIRNTLPKEILEEINCVIDKEKEVKDYIPKRGELLISTWQESNVLFLESDDFICIPDKLALLSRERELLICTVCEGAMVSYCSKWEYGNLSWKIFFEPSTEDMIYKLASLNIDQAKLDQLNAKANEEVKLYDLDEAQVGFLVPIISFDEHAKFRYDNEKMFHEYTALFRYVITAEKAK